MHIVLHEQFIKLFILVDDLISLTENVASALTSGNVTADLINNLSANLCVHGPQLEIISKESLDR